MNARNSYGVVVARVVPPGYPVGEIWDFACEYVAQTLPDKGDLITVTVHSEGRPFEIRAVVTQLRDDEEYPIHAEEVLDT